MLRRKKCDLAFLCVTTKHAAGGGFLGKTGEVLELEGSQYTMLENQKWGGEGVEVRVQESGSLGGDLREKETGKEEGSNKEVSVAAAVVLLVSGST